MSSDTPLTFPPLPQADDHDEADAIGGLRRALCRVLRRNEWSGVPDNASVASALRLLRAPTEGVDQGARARHLAILLDALIAGLTNQTSDGWKIDIRPRTGRPKGSSFAQQDADDDLAEWTLDRLVDGDPFESAVAAAMNEFGVSRGKVTKELRRVRSQLREVQELVRSGVQDFESRCR